MLRHIEYKVSSYYYEGNADENDIKQAISWWKNIAETHHRELPKYRDDITEIYRAMRRELMSHRTEVFISYTRSDSNYLSELKKYLDSLQLNHGIKSWYDGMIAPGAKWENEIKTHMSIAKVAILLVSQAFLVSEFVRYEELPELLQAAEDEEATVLWIPIEVSQVKDTIIKGKKGGQICISDYNAVCDPQKPLSDMTIPERNRIYNAICHRIKKAFAL